MWVKLNETDWWPGLECGVQLPNNNILPVIGISGEAGQGLSIEKYSATKSSLKIMEPKMFVFLKDKQPKKNPKNKKHHQPVNRMINLYAMFNFLSVD